MAKETKIRKERKDFHLILFGIIIKSIFFSICFRFYFYLFILDHTKMSEITSLMGAKDEF